MIKNTISRIRFGNSMLTHSQLHLCAQCNMQAEERNPLVRFTAIVDLGKRKPRPIEVHFFAHSECLKIDESTVWND